MFIGGLSWQTSPGMFTSSDIDFFKAQCVLIQMASKYEKFRGRKIFFFSFFPLTMQKIQYDKKFFAINI